MSVNRTATLARLLNSAICKRGSLRVVPNAFMLPSLADLPTVINLAGKSKKAERNSERKNKDEVGNTAKREGIRGEERLTEK